MANKKLKLAVLISGRGSNMQALARACQQPDYPAEISVVLSNSQKAEGLLWAQEHDIPTEIVDNKTCLSREGFESVLQEKLSPYNIDLICLAGFMRLLSESFVKEWYNKIINIHPSLLPDYKGLNTHERVIADKCNKSGCTVHFVRSRMDSGPIIMQKAVAVLPNDTAETLAARVLKEEHLAYPEAIALIASRKVRNFDEQVEFT